MSATVLRRRYQRLLAVYPGEWRAANETVVLDTLLEAAGPTRRWPSPRESFALLLGGVRAWTRRPRPDAGERARRWLDGLQLGGILLAAWSLAAILGQLLSWLAHNTPADSGAVTAFDAAPAVLAAVAFVALLRGRVRLALVAVVIWVLAGVLRAVIGFPEVTAVDGIALGPALVVWLVVFGALPLLAVLAVLVWRGGARSRSWASLLVPAALAIAFAWAPVVLAVVILVSLVGLVAALVLAKLTGEVRPVVALAVVGLPWILGTVLGVLSSTVAALAVALAARGALHARQSDA